MHSFGDCDAHSQRRGSQSIPIDVKAVFHSSTWEPTVLATSHWPVPCARCAPSLRAISVDLDAAADQAISACGGDARKTVNRLIAANDFLGLRAVLSKDYSRGQLPRVRELKDALRGRTCCFLLFVLPNWPIADSGVRRNGRFAPTAVIP